MSGERAMSKDAQTVHQTAAITTGVLVVREAGRDDARAISNLLRCAFLEFEPLYTPEAFLATAPSEIGTLARLEEGPLWVVEGRDALVGTVSAKCLSDSVYIRGMAVHPAARGLGLGRMLLAQMERFARQQNRKYLCLYTTAFLKQAIHLYQRAGFRFTGETANPHGVELLRMVKALGTTAKQDRATR